MKPWIDLSIFVRHLFTMIIIGICVQKTFFSLFILKLTFKIFLLFEKIEKKIEKNAMTILSSSSTFKFFFFANFNKTLRLSYYHFDGHSFYLQIFFFNTIILMMTTMMMPFINIVMEVLLNFFFQILSLSFLFPPIIKKLNFDFSMIKFSQFSYKMAFFLFACLSPFVCHPHTHIIQLSKDKNDKNHEISGHFCQFLSIFTLVGVNMHTLKCYTKKNIWTNRVPHFVIFRPFIHNWKK